MTTPVVVPIESEYEKLKAPIQEIIAFTNTIDERYREKCFEVLLNFYLNRHITDTSATTEVAALPKTEPTSTVATVPLAIRAFLTQNNISEEAIKKLFLMEKGEAIPIYKIQETKKATAQIQLTMLVALRNALVNTASMLNFLQKM